MREFLRISSAICVVALCVGYLFKTLKGQLTSEIEQNLTEELKSVQVQVVRKSKLINSETFHFGLSDDSEIEVSPEFFERFEIGDTLTLEK